jgi:heme/copper-type cytochrome/quinol oxidase subunit 1
MVLSIIAIGVVGFYVWAHHMFVAGIADDTRLYFSSATMVIAVPTAVKLFAWAATSASVSCVCAELVSVLALMLVFLVGGFTGLALASSAMDVVYHDSYFVVGHFHLVLSVAALLGVLIALRAFVSSCWGTA